MMPAPHPKKHFCLFQLLFVTAFPVAWRVFENSNFRAVYCYSVTNKKTRRSKLRQSPLCYCKASEQVTVFLFPVTKAVPTQQRFPCGEGTELPAGVSTMLCQFSSAERHRQLAILCQLMVQLQSCFAEGYTSALWQAHIRSPCRNLLGTMCHHTRGRGEAASAASVTIIY